MKLQINKISLENIFCQEFNQLTSNNVIDFTQKKICILYGPNGTGKTSFSNVMNQNKDSKYEIVINDKTYSEADEKLAHVISDQNGRNLIAGSTEDFILGDNIKREYELKKQLENGFSSLFTSLIDELKKSYSITTKSSPISQLIIDENIKTYISDLANNKSKGSGINKRDFLKKINELSTKNIPEHDDIKLKFVISDYAKNSIISSLRGIRTDQIKPEKQIVKIDESDTAIKVLEKFHYLDDCVVCL